MSATYLLCVWSRNYHAEKTTHWLNDCGVQIMGDRETFFFTVRPFIFYSGSPTYVVLNAPVITITWDFVIWYRAESIASQQTKPKMDRCYFFVSQDRKMQSVVLFNVDLCVFNRVKIRYVFSNTIWSKNMIYEFWDVRDFEDISLTSQKQNREYIKRFFFFLNLLPVLII